MKKDDKVVCAINECYVVDDCMQIMIPFKNAATILSQDGILFHSKKGSTIYINKYLEDERRNQFPYSNIPMHYTRKGLFGKVCYVNQIFDFKKPYILISNGGMVEYVAFKDNNRALLASPTTISLENKTIMTMSYDELLDYFSKENKIGNNNQFPYITLDGGFISSDSIVADIETGFVEKTIDFVRPFISVEFDNNNLKTKMTKIYLNCDGFGQKIGKVITYDIPITKYILEQLKFAEIINNTKEPKISLKLNPGISQKDIDLAIQKVKK